MSVYSYLLSGVCLILLCPLSLTSQSESCGFKSVHEQLIKHHPEYRRVFIHNDENLQPSPLYRRGMPENIEIPVVFHVIHNGESMGTGSNVSEAQLKNSLDWLNRAFAGRDHYTTTPSGIQFRLAKRTPDCTSTNGITRIDGSDICVDGDCYGSKGITSLNEHAVKSASQWAPHQYLNVWVVTEINDNNGNGGIQGYAYLPGAPTNLDGVVILSNSIGFDPDDKSGFDLKAETSQNGVLVHEVGHSLGLYHSFEGDDGNRDGRSDRCPSQSGCGLFNGDCVEDTPAHKRSKNDCVSSGINVCDGGYSPDLFIHNFMDYSSQECQTEFTPNQIERMREMVLTHRGGWMQSKGQFPPVEEDIELVCVPNTKVLNQFYKVGIRNFSLGSFSHSSGTAFEDGGYVNNRCLEIRVTAGDKLNLNITTGPHNKENVKVFVDVNGDGDFVDAGENIFSSKNKKIHSGAITIPTQLADEKLFTLRVVSDFTAYSIKDGCYRPILGQVEDYLLSTRTGDGEEDKEGAGDEDATDGDGNGTPAKSDLELRATYYGFAIFLTWKFEKSDQIDKYEIERSLDGKNFVKIKDQKYTASASGGYRVIDILASNNSIYYRLKRVLKDGQQSFSNTVIVNTKSSYTVDFQPSVHPNPVHGGVATLKLPFVEKAEIMLIDPWGRTLKKFRKQKNVTSQQLDLSGMVPGLYYLKVSYGKSIWRQTLVVE